MKYNTRLSLISLVILLLANITFGKSIDVSSPDKDNVSSENSNEDQNYLIFVNNTYGDINIFTKPKNLKRHEINSYEFAFSFMDDIHELIVKNKNTFKNPEKLKEIENKNKLKKREGKNEPITVYDSSNFVHFISSKKNKLVIKAYLSQALVQKVKQIENASSVIADKPVELFTHYNENDILAETQWKQLSVRENADLHLSLLSQGKYKEDLIGEYDTNYYYPSSAGKDIDIILFDDGFYFNYAEFNNTDDRVVKCQAYLDDDDEIHESEFDYKCGELEPHKKHGRMIADVVGGLVHGSASRANIYGIAMVSYGYKKFFISTVMKGLEYISQNMIRPNKTVISLSFGGSYEIDSDLFRQYESILDEIKEKGAIIVVGAGNAGNSLYKDYYVPYTEGDKILYYYNFKELILPCASRSTICVGGVESVFNDNFIEMSYTKAESSNYGEQVDIYAPFYSVVEYIEDMSYVNNINLEKQEGTSFSAPIAAGVVATIMSEFNQTIFTRDSMMDYLIDNGLPFYFNGGLHYMINNGKHIVYSKNDEYTGCGISAGNRSCKSSCEEGSCDAIQSLRADCYLKHGEFLFDPKYKENNNMNYACMVKVEEDSKEIKKFNSTCTYVNADYKCVYRHSTSYSECDISNEKYKPDTCYRNIFDFIGSREFNADVIAYYREQCENRNGIFARDEYGDFICLDYFFGEDISKGYYCVSARFHKDGHYLREKHFCINDEYTNYNVCNKTYSKGNKSECFNLINYMFENELFTVDHSFSLQVTKYY